MKILQVSSTDLVGQRFNGQYLTQVLPLFGHEANHMVWHKEGSSEHTHLMVDLPFRRTIQKISAKIEDQLSIRALLHPTSWLFKNNDYFKSADVVHYQIMHWPNFFSLLALPGLTRRKPSVWTIHDFWAMTGHCVCTFGCDRWQIGCGQCPNLKSDFSMKKDRTRVMWEFKNRIYSKSQLDLVVASQFMKDNIEKSPLFKRFDVHLVPFGLDLGIYKPQNLNYSKKILGIEENEIAIAFRSSRSPFKGLKYILEALRELKSDKKICLLSFDEKWNLEEFRNKYKIVDLGWVHDDSLLRCAFDAADFFVMPSMQESFGMMSVEAMAFGKPVIVFSGTALPGVIGGNDNGFVVESGDARGLLNAMSALIENDPLRLKKGMSALRRAQTHYSVESHVRGLLEVYNKAIKNFKG